MARYTGSSWKKSRRLQFSTLENEKEFAISKGGKERRISLPGEHPRAPRKFTEYGIQLREKQRVRHLYGVGEKQFVNTFNKAGKMAGQQGDNFLITLEARLDNLVYRMGFASTRRQARQLVNHGHMLVDGKKIDIPSYICKPGQVISLREKSRKLKIVNENLEVAQNRKAYVSFDEKKKEGTFVRLPERDEFLTEIRVNLIVEYYNR